MTLANTVERPLHTGAEIKDVPGILEGRKLPFSPLILVHDYQVITASWYVDGILRVCGHCGQILGFRRREKGWEMVLKGDGSCTGFPGGPPFEENP